MGTVNAAVPLHTTVTICCVESGPQSGSLLSVTSVTRKVPSVVKVRVRSVVVLTVVVPSRQVFTSFPVEVLVKVIVVPGSTVTPPPVKPATTGVGQGGRQPRLSRRLRRRPSMKKYMRSRCPAVKAL